MIIVICLVMALLVVLYLRSNRSTHVELEAKDEELLESQRACYRLKTSLESEQAQAAAAEKLRLDQAARIATFDGILEEADKGKRQLQDHLHQKEVARLQLLQQLRRVNRLVKDLRRDGGGPSTSASHAAEDLSEQGGLLNNPLYSSGGASDADFMGTPNSGRNNADIMPSPFLSEGACPPFNPQQTPEPQAVSRISSLTLNPQPTPDQQAVSRITAELVSKQQEADATEQQLRAQIASLQADQTRSDELQSDREQKDQASLAERRVHAEMQKQQQELATQAAQEREALQQASVERTAELTTSHFKCTSLSGELRALQETCALHVSQGEALQAQLAETRASAAAASQRQEQQQAEIAHLRQQVSDTTAASAATQQEREQLASQVETLQSRCTVLQDLTDSATAQAAAVVEGAPQGTVLDLMQQLDDATAQASDLRQQLETAFEQILTRQRGAQESAAQTELLQATVMTLTQQAEEATSQLAASQAERALLVAQVESQRGCLTDLDLQVIDLQAQLGTQMDAQNEISIQLEQQLQAAANAGALHATEIEEREDALNELVSIRSMLEREVNALEAEGDKLQERNAALAERTAAQAARTAALEREAASSLSSCEALQAALKGAQESETELRGQLSVVESKQGEADAELQRRAVEEAQGAAEVESLRLVVAGHAEMSETASAAAALLQARLDVAVQALADSEASVATADAAAASAVVARQDLEARIAAVADTERLAAAGAAAANAAAAAVVTAVDSAVGEELDQGMDPLVEDRDQLLEQVALMSAELSSVRKALTTSEKSSALQTNTLSLAQAELENQSQELSLMGSLVERYSLAVSDMLSVVMRLKDSVQLGSQSVTPQLEHLDKLTDVTLLQLGTYQMEGERLAAVVLQHTSDLERIRNERTGLQKVRDALKKHIRELEEQAAAAAVENGHEAEAAFLQMESARVVQLTVQLANTERELADSKQEASLLAALQEAHESRQLGLQLSSLGTELSIATSVSETATEDVQRLHAAALAAATAHSKLREQQWLQGTRALADAQLRYTTCKQRLDDMSVMVIAELAEKEAMSAEHARLRLALDAAAVESSAVLAQMATLRDEGEAASALSSAAADEARLALVGVQGDLDTQTAAAAVSAREAGELLVERDDAMEGAAAAYRDMQKVVAERDAALLTVSEQILELTALREEHSQQMARTSVQASELLQETARLGCQLSSITEMRDASDGAWEIEREALMGQLLSVTAEAQAASVLAQDEVVSLTAAAQAAEVLARDELSSVRLEAGAARVLAQERILSLTAEAQSAEVLAQERQVAAINASAMIDALQESISASSATMHLRSVALQDETDAAIAARKELLVQKQAAAQASSLLQEQIAELQQRLLDKDQQMSAALSASSQHLAQLDLKIQDLQEHTHAANLSVEATAATAAAAYATAAATAAAELAASEAAASAASAAAATAAAEYAAAVVTHNAMLAASADESRLLQRELDGALAELAELEPFKQAVARSMVKLQELRLENTRLMLNYDVVNAQLSIVEADRNVLQDALQDVTEMQAASSQELQTLHQQVDLDMAAYKESQQMLVIALDQLATKQGEVVGLQGSLDAMMAREQEVKSDPSSATARQGGASNDGSSISGFVSEVQALLQQQLRDAEKAEARAQSDIAVLTGRLEFKKGQMEDFMLKIHDKTIANCALLKRVETLEGDLQQLRELNLTLTSTHSTTTADAAIADAGADSTTAVNATTAASGGGSSPSSPSKHDNGGVPIRTSIGSLKIQLQLSEAQLTASRNHSEASLLQLQELKMTLRLRDEQVLSLSSQFALLQAKLQEEARERERSLIADMNTYRVTPLSSGTITPMLPLPPMDIFTLHEAYTLAQQQQQMLQPRHTGSSNNSQGDLRLNSSSSLLSVQMGLTSRRSSVMDSGMIGGAGTGLPMMSLAEVVSHMGALSSKILGIQSQSWRLISRSPRVSSPSRRATLDAPASLALSQPPSPLISHPLPGYTHINDQVLAEATNSTASMLDETTSSPASNSSTPDLLRTDWRTSFTAEGTHLGNPVYPTGSQPHRDSSHLEAVAHIVPRRLATAAAELFPDSTVGAIAPLALGNHPATNAAVASADMGVGHGVGEIRREGGKPPVVLANGSSEQQLQRTPTRGSISVSASSFAEDLTSAEESQLRTRFGCLQQAHHELLTQFNSLAEQLQLVSSMQQQQMKDNEGVMQDGGVSVGM